MKNKNFFKISLIYFIAMICIATLFVLGSFGIITNEFWATFLIQIVVMFAIPTLLYTLIISKNTKKTFKDLGFSKFSFKMLLISIALGFILYFINKNPLRLRHSGFLSNIFLPPCNFDAILAIHLTNISTNCCRSLVFFDNSFALEEKSRH